MTTTDGTIKRITDRGFGFIATAEGSEYFFHQSACVGTAFDELREGQAVSTTSSEPFHTAGHNLANKSCTRTLACHRFPVDS